MIKIEKGMKFRFKSKYDESYYDGIADYVIGGYSEGGRLFTTFYSTNNILYKSNEVYWLDDIRDEKLKDLGL